MARNIVIFSDGTGQEGGEGHNTNIYKIFNLIEDRTDRQIAFYDPGIGTGLVRYTAFATGFGFSKNLKQCYRFIFEHYNAGDNIYLLGFSRGAATVRSLSSFIHYFGILPKSRPELIDKAYRIYRISDEEKRRAKAKEFIDRHHTMWTKVKFIGCFDTVAALGIPWKTASAIINAIPLFKHRFHNFDLSPCIENACQALAIDDERKTFHPVLWNPLPENDPRVMKQAWFCGMHTDVGGGYPEQELSDIPLVWLTHMAVNHGLRIYPGNRVRILEDANGTMHDSHKGMGKLYRREQRSWDANRPDRPIVHASVLERKRLDGNYNPWILGIDHETEKWIKYEDQDWYTPRPE